MRALVLARAAEEDMVGIWTHLRAASERAADRVVDDIAREIDLLIDFPFIGRIRPEFGQGHRSLAVGNYVIFYRASEEGVEVSRVLHGARDIAAILSADEAGSTAPVDQIDECDG